MCAGCVANGNHKDTQEASSISGPVCYVAACPTSALRDFVRCYTNSLEKVYNVGGPNAKLLGVVRSCKAFHFLRRANFQA